MTTATVDDTGGIVTVGLLMNSDKLRHLRRDRRHPRPPAGPPLP